MFPWYINYFKLIIYFLRNNRYRKNCENQIGINSSEETFAFMKKISIYLCGVTSKRKNFIDGDREGDGPSPPVFTVLFLITSQNLLSTLGILFCLLLRMLFNFFILFIFFLF